MAFDFGSDILVDAMRAANPGKAAEAKLALERLSETRGKTTSSAEFSSELTRLGRSQSASIKPEDAMQKFEAAVLTTFVQAMMPKDGASVFGSGLAGDMWKAQMAEKLADQISKSGGIGIASRLLKDYQKVGEDIAPVQGLSDPADALRSSRSIDGATQFLQRVELDSLLRDGTESTKNSTVVKPGGVT